MESGGGCSVQLFRKGSMMESFLIYCPNCGKPIVVTSGLSSFACPYCEKEVEPERQRNELLTSVAEERKNTIQKMIDAGDYDDARTASFEALSSLETKAIFLALVLECDLLRHHPFFFNCRVIEEDVNAILSATDYSALPDDEIKKIRVTSLRALGLFYKRAKDCLNRHGDFVGERYDAISRFAYVGMCCAFLNKIGVESESLAKECAQIISDICSGSFGDVYNMPTEIYQEAERVEGSLSREFRFSSTIHLQSNPHAVITPAKKGLICPICDATLPKIDKGQFMTCLACRHRISIDAIQNASLFAEPISYQDMLEHRIVENDLQGAKEVLHYLRRKDSSNSNYAMAELIVRRDTITPLSLHLNGYPDLINLASSADAETYQGEMAKTVEHLKTIRSILYEASTLAHGPSNELINMLDEFLNQIATFDRA